MSLRPQDVLVVVPAFNEENSIAGVVEAVRAAGYEIVVVSDGSTDGTVRECRKIGARVLQLPINLGVGGALRTGFQHACRRGYKAVIQVDADGQHDPRLIDQLLHLANETSADLVLGSRFTSHETTMRVGLLRRFVMRLLATSASVATRTTITDATSGFRLIRRPLLDHLSTNLPTNYLGDTYESLIAAGRAGYGITEMPASMKEREFGESSASVLDAVRFTIKGLGVFFLGLHPKIEEKLDPACTRAAYKSQTG